MQALAQFVMRGRAQAVAVVIVAAGLSMPLPLFSLFSIAALALVTLRHGAAEGLRIFGLSLLVVAALGMMSAAGLSVAVGFGLGLWLPIFLIALVLRETGSLLRALETAFGLGFAVVTAAYLVVGDMAALWVDFMQTLLGPVLADRPPAEVQQIKENIAAFSRYMTGSVAGFWMALLVLGLVLARWWQALLYNPGGFRAEFVRLRMPSWLAYLGLCSLALAWIQQGFLAELAWSLNVLFFLLFLIAGLAVLHAVLANGGSWRFVLTGVYLALIFIPQVLLPVALLGFSDVWLDWRSRRWTR